MGGPVARIAAGVMTGGISEIGQKKPFQDLGKDAPIGGASKTLRFLPGGSSIGGLMDLASPKPPDPPTPPQSLSTQDTAVQQAVSEASQRRARARGYRSTILSQMLPSSMRNTFGG